ncbi:MAG: hypothetical protein ACE5FT_02575, partial [Candidatus Nanoarchaeia archaeon]
MGTKAAYVVYYDDKPVGTIATDNFFFMYTGQTYRPEQVAFSAGKPMARTLEDLDLFLELEERWKTKAEE